MRSKKFADLKWLKCNPKEARKSKGFTSFITSSFQTCKQCKQSKIILIFNFASSWSSFCFLSLIPRVLANLQTTMSHYH